MSNIRFITINDRNSIFFKEKVLKLQVSYAKTHYLIKFDMTKDLSGHATIKNANAKGT